MKTTDVENYLKHLQKKKKKYWKPYANSTLRKYIAALTWFLSDILASEIEKIKTGKIILKDLPMVEYEELEKMINGCKMCYRPR